MIEQPVCVCVWTEIVTAECVHRAAAAPPAACSHLSSPIWPPGGQAEEAPDSPRQRREGSTSLGRSDQGGGGVRGMEAGGRRQRG